MNFFLYTEHTLFNQSILSSVFIAGKRVVANVNGS